MKGAKKKISQKDAHMVLDMLGELLVSCQSWGLDIRDGIFAPRDADTGKLIPGAKSCLDRYGEQVVRIRRKIGQLKWEKR